MTLNGCKSSYESRYVSQSRYRAIETRIAASAAVPLAGEGQAYKQDSYDPSRTRGKCFVAHVELSRPGIKLDSHEILGK